jgi:hypothetical protein
MPKPRFVLLEHTCETPHFDFMLEAGGRLMTWRLAHPPVPGQEQEAERIGNHRLLYLDYEGPLSGGRGHVRRWDHGTFAGEVNDSPIRIQLRGAKLQGQVVLEQADGDRWLLRFGKIAA